MRSGIIHTFAEDKFVHCSILQEKLLERRIWGHFEKGAMDDFTRTVANWNLIY